MIQTCFSVLAGVLTGVAVYKIQKHADKKSQTTQNHSSFQDEQVVTEDAQSFQSCILLKMLRILSLIM